MAAAESSGRQDSAAHAILSHTLLGTGRSFLNTFVASAPINVCERELLRVWPSSQRLVISWDGQLLAHAHCFLSLSAPHN